MSIISAVIAVLGVASLLYFIVCICYAGISSSFSFLWLAVGVFLLGVTFGIDQLHKHEIHIPMVFKVIVLILVVLGAAVFGYVEALIVRSSHDMPKEEVSYVIVLGARIDGTRVTKSLAKRLDAAYEYGKDHKNTKFIVSGGKGTGEDVTEAQAMEEYLINKGIEKERIIKEEASINTDQNIQFSREIIKDDSASVAIVTNSFHLYRAMRIAQKQGLANVSGIAAPTDKILAFSYYVREGLAVMKYKLAGQI